MSDQTFTTLQLLEKAITSRHLYAVRAILATERTSPDGSSTSVAVTDDDVDEALYSAAVVGFVEACRLLWQKLSPSAKEKYTDADEFPALKSPLHLAARGDHRDVVRLFVEEYHFNVNQFDPCGRTPLHYAVKEYDGDEHPLSRFLLENGANVNMTRGAHRKSILDWAVYYSNTSLVRLLLFEYGADPMITCGPINHEQEMSGVNGWGPITSTAITNGDEEILRMLLEKGAYVGHSDICAHVLSYMVNGQPHRSRDTKLSICRMFVEHGRHQTGTAALLQATFRKAIQYCCSQDFSRFEILLEAGMDPSTAMDIAVSSL
jgi:ankyrin repeat protein